MKISTEEKYRVVTLLTEEERDNLHFLAEHSQRSMSGYLRYLVIKEIAEYPE